VKGYYRLMLGRQSAFAEECFAGGFVGVDFMEAQDFTGHLPEEWREFNAEYIPTYLADQPDKTRVAAGLACGATWTACKGIKVGDLVICPDGHGRYRAGEVTSEYSYLPGATLPHRRQVRWLDCIVDRADLSPDLRGSASSQLTVVNLGKYADELERLLGGHSPAVLVSSDETVEDPVVFALEKHLEDFLVRNWPSTLLGKDYDIYRVEGELVGQQFPTDTGPIDILALHKDKSELLVVELKRGRASDVVVGQIQRYMGFVKSELAEAGQTVKGVIIALEDDIRIRRALSIAHGIDFYRYQVSFSLTKTEL
jgi:restriction system protein